jgi:hypothetical protein
MECHQNDFVELMNFLDLEKVNFKKEDNYLKICEILNGIYKSHVSGSSNEISALYEKEKENNIFLRASRKNLMKDNQKQYVELVKYRDLYNKINHKYENLKVQK